MKAIVAKQAEREIECIHDEMLFGDLEMDSLDVVETLIEIEDELRLGELKLRADENSIGRLILHVQEQACLRDWRINKGSIHHIQTAAKAIWSRIEGQSMHYINGEALVPPSLAPRIASVFGERIEIFWPYQAISFRQLCTHIQRGIRGMSTEIVPGHDPANNDVLAAGCWAEHEDGSLLYVSHVSEGKGYAAVTPPGEVTFLLIAPDGSYSQWPGRMPVSMFKMQFSRAEGTPKDYIWTWHDKTPFPWECAKPRPEVIETIKEIEVERQLDVVDSAALRVATALKLRAAELAPEIRKFAAAELGNLFSSLIGKLPEK